MANQEKVSHSLRTSRISTHIQIDHSSIYPRGNGQTVVRTTQEFCHEVRWCAEFQVLVSISDSGRFPGQWKLAAVKNTLHRSCLKAPWSRLNNQRLRNGLCDVYK